MSGSIHKIQHSLRLVRAGNLLIIALSMILIKFVVFEAWLMNMLVEEHAVDAGTSFTEAFVLSPHYQINFVLLVISTVSIGAAGNIINDYFDIKADRVNRPDTIVIGKHIKRRWAIVTHWGFNLIGTLIAVYLSWYYRDLTLLIIPLSAAFLLWAYSTYLKRKQVIGNVCIALLTSLVIILSMRFMQNELPDESYFQSYASFDLSLEPAIFLSVLLAAFAFITNFTREIVKDLRDVEGDLKMQCNTLPIAQGERFTRVIIGGLLGLQLLFMILIVAVGNNRFEGVSWFATTIAVGILLAYGAAFMINIFAKTREGHYHISTLLKLIMLFGMLFPLNVLL